MVSEQFPVYQNQAEVNVLYKKKEKHYSDCKKKLQSHYRTKTLLQNG